MNAPLIQLLVLAGIALFLVLKLRDVLGTRTGFEKPAEAIPGAATAVVVDDAPDEGDDFADHLDDGHSALPALRQIHAIEPDFSLTTFLHGAKQAYEMILMAFERGDLTDVRPFLAPEVAEALQGAVDARTQKGHTTEANFLGTRETGLHSAAFDPQTSTAELTVRFVGELIAATRDASGAVVDGDPKSARKQRDLWTFERRIGQDDPNWLLVATG